ncbi:MAG: MMPL family transporter [Proteobacteria bacterium]|nr:MMPL family transporter [Pseudomonadota bacterium]
MSDIKSNIETLFNRLGHGIFRNRIKVLIIMVMFIGALASQIPFLTIDTSFEGMLRENHPDRVALNAFRDQFKGSELIVLMIKSPDIFNEDFLTRLNAFHKDIEKNVPFLLEVNSLINARRITGTHDALFVDDLFKNWPDQAVDMPEIKQYVMTHSFFPNHLISEDGQYTAIILETQATLNDHGQGDDVLSDFQPDQLHENKKNHKKIYFSEKENTRVVMALEQIIKTHDKKDFSIAVTGSPMIVEAYNRSTQKDIGFLIVLSSLAMILFLALLFRRLSGVIFPFIVVQSALISTLGLMSLGHVSISIMTMILPSFLIAVGVADAIHVLTIFFQRFKLNHDKEEAISYALGHSGLAIVMTSLTTAAGLLSFSFAELSAIGDLGIYASAGVLLALIYTIVMLPALLAITPIKHKESVHDEKPGLIHHILMFFTRLSTGHPVKIVMVSLILCIISIVYIFQINLSHDTLEYFPDSMAIKPDLISVDKHLKGNLALDLVLDTKTKDGVCDPIFLNQLEKALNDISGITFDTMYAGKIFSMIDILKETNQALHDNDPMYYRIPQDRNLIIQELLLFENSGSDDLSRFVDSQYSTLRISIKIPWVDLVITDRFIDTIKNRLHETFDNQCTITITGLTSLMARTLPIALSSMTESYIIALLIISLLMILLVGDIKTGLISMIPNLLPILMALGIMGFAHIPMDLSALMIGSIAIGLVVDDTMHFFYHFRKNILATGDVHKAVQDTMLGTGRAMLITSLVLGSNFFVYTLATLNNLTIFGSITGLIVILALLADFLVTPAVLVILWRSAPNKTFAKEQIEGLA